MGRRQRPAHRTAVMQDDMGAMACQAPGDGLAEAGLPARAGDQGNLAC